MDKLNITPKPWHVMRGDVLDHHGRMVAAVDSFDTDDARLIAAAPELLEALQEMVAIVKKNSYPCPDKPNSNYARAEAAETIIAKALGK